jgi:hypothetical protein
MKVLRHIFPVILTVMLLVSCGGRDGKVIPRGEFAEIYAQMLLMDQWISQTPGARHIADTSLVYEPILNEHGYTSSDYRKSVDVYMDDPERFSRILRETVGIFDGMLKELEVKKAEQTRLEEIRKHIEQLRESVVVDMEKYFPDVIHEQPDTVRRDSTYWSLMLNLWESRE